MAELIHQGLLCFFAIAAITTCPLYPAKNLFLTDVRVRLGDWRFQESTQRAV